MKEIKKPAFMQEANQRPGHLWILEIFICCLVLTVSSFAMGVIQVPAMFAWLLQGEDYLRMMRTGNLDPNILLKLVENIPEWYTIVTLYSEIFMILVVLLYCWFFEKRRPQTLGFFSKGWFSEYAAGLGIGAAMLFASYAICVVLQGMSFPKWAHTAMPLYVPLYFGGYLIQGMAEEVLCRGYLMVTLSRRNSIQYSMVLSSIFFMMLHLNNPNMTLLSVLNLFLFGYFMAVLFIESGNIWIVSALHSAWNFCQGNLLGVNVSGLKGQSTIWTAERYGGRWAQLINGGGFGLEGGLAVTVVLCVGIWYLYRRMEKKRILIGTEEEELISADNQGYPVMGQEEPERKTNLGTVREDSSSHNPDKKRAVTFETVLSAQKPEGEKREEDPKDTMFNADYFKDE